ncbi:AAE17 [Symbiodinium microadriaticum]|nr:AAE17 [Symbiodinium microadriaticum]
MEFVSSSLLPEALYDHLSEEQKISLASAQLVSDPLKRWSAITKTVLTPSLPWEVHKTLYENNYKECAVAPAWIPNTAEAAHTNIGRMMSANGFARYVDFYNWSVNSPEEFWDACIKELGVVFDVPYRAVFEDHPEHGVKSVDYIPGSKLNIVASCFSQRQPHEAALVYASETDATIHTLTFAELEALANRVANSLVNPVGQGGLGLSAGDSVGICMAMSPEAVGVYLGIVKAGLAVVSIADSFSAREIEMRMRLAGAKAVFTQDVVYRRDKVLPIFARVSQANEITAAAGNTSPYCIILPGNDANLHQSVVEIMKPGLDMSWRDFLGSSSSTFEYVLCAPQTVCNILFSSGTTGEPKAIPWTHATPIKCAVDDFLHQDIRRGDVVAWPTNLGWMMGPWLLFQMINGATIALFGGVTSTAPFCKFVENANVSMVGVVPSLVKAWEATDATADCDWTCVKKFSSSGEASDPASMLWLMSRANYKPVIEYCGGTEVAGSYMSSTMVQPNCPSMFSTPVLGSNFVVLDDRGNETHQGEIALVPPALGLSTRLLNRDHHDCYYTDMPTRADGKVLRRHGDELQVVVWGDEGEHRYFRALGRCDDTMNIGGIKVASVEIERVCNEIEDIAETAAIGVSPPSGGPSSLILFVILKDGSKQDHSSIKPKLQVAIKSHLNPLFHIGAVLIKDKLPRTASNKVMRRVLRDEYVQETFSTSSA